MYTVSQFHNLMNNLMATVARPWWLRLIILKEVGQCSYTTFFFFLCKSPRLARNLRMELGSVELCVCVYATTVTTVLHLPSRGTSNLSLLVVLRYTTSVSIEGYSVSHLVVRYGLTTDREYTAGYSTEPTQSQCRHLGLTDYRFPILSMYTRNVPQCRNFSAAPLIRNYLQQSYRHVHTPVAGDASLVFNFYPELQAKYCVAARNFTF